MNEQDRRASSLPHSRTCRRRPPPPRTVWVLLRPVCFLLSADARPVTVAICLPPWGRRNAIVAASERGHIGRRALSLPARRPIFQRRDAQGRLAQVADGAILGGVVGRAIEASWDATTTSRSSSYARRDRDGNGGDRPRSPERLASERPACAASSPARAREHGFEVLFGRSIDLVGTELPFQPFVEALRAVGEPPPARRADDRLSTTGIRTDARARLLTAQPPRLCCSCSRTSIGLIRPHSTSSSTSRTTSTTAGTAARDLPRWRAHLGERMWRLADGVRQSGWVGGARCLGRSYRRADDAVAARSRRLAPTPG